MTTLALPALPSVGELNVFLTGGTQPTTNVTLAVSLPTSEQERQEEVIMARRYHAGRHDVQLTDRLGDWLSGGNAANALRLNVVRLVNLAVAERLMVAGFKCECEDPEESQRQTDLAELVWSGSRMEVKQADVHEEATVDGEHFLLITWDADNGRPKLTPHPRYTGDGVAVSGEAGNGYGVQMHYPNNDTSEKPDFASKRWSEYVQVRERDGTTVARRVQFLTLYFPDRIEKYQQSANIADNGSFRTWEKLATPIPLTDADGQYILDERGAVQEGDLWPIPWEDPATGEPLGIPVVHFKNPQLWPEAREAWGLQDAINKELLDLLAASDLTAFQFFITYGWKMEDAQGNGLTMDPGSAVGTTNTDAKTDIVKGASLAEFRDTIQNLIQSVATVTDTPVDRLTTGQVRAEGTLQEMKESLIKKVQRRASGYGVAYEDALRIARRLWNAFGPDAGIDGFVELSTEYDVEVCWAPFVARSVADQKAQAELYALCGATPEDMKRDVLGWDADRVQASEMARLGMGEIPGANAN